MIHSPAPTKRQFPLFAATLALLMSSGPHDCEAATTPAQPWDNARQLVLVISPDWNASNAILRTFERTAHGWRAVSDRIPVTIGRAGAAWGIGLHAPQPGARKKEGDGRSPAGVFAVGGAFGYAKSVPTHLPYTAMTIDDYCIDVAGSPAYNRIVNKHDVGEAAVLGSTEPMRRDLHADGDQAYKMGFVIEHNPRGVAGAGSCIFAHLSVPADSPTVGCTAMAEPAMRTLLAWLRARENPIFVLLPQEEYGSLRAAWQLP